VLAECLAGSVRANTARDAGQRIGGLDGLRAISIALVFISHLYWSKQYPALGFLWRFQLGDLGVRIFFVISGFIITHLLLAEMQRTGTVSLWQFYIRRSLRIFPAYYLFLACIAAASAWGTLAADAMSLARSAFYVSNYFPRPAELAHTWSLSVEEQFYLLWPAVLLLLGTRRAGIAATVLMVGAVAIRTAHSLPLSDETNVFWVRFETGGDAIAMGCLLALGREQLWRTAAYRALCTSAGTAAAACAVLLLATTHRWPWLWNSLGITLMNACIVVLLDGCMRARGDWRDKWLNARPIASLGVWSYSLYLWQQLFLTGASTLPFAARMALTFTAALLSYYMVERPLVRWRASRL